MAAELPAVEMEATAAATAAAALMEALQAEMARKRKEREERKAAEQRQAAAAAERWTRQRMAGAAFFQYDGAFSARPRVDGVDIARVGSAARLARGEDEGGDVRPRVRLRQDPHGTPPPPATLPPPSASPSALAPPCAAAAAAASTASPS